MSFSVLILALSSFDPLTGIENELRDFYFAVLTKSFHRVNHQLLVLYSSSSHQKLK